MQIHSGIDLVEVSRFESLNPAIRSRFFERVFNQNEREYISDNNQRAAGLFAAKEACAKALGCGIGPIRWVDIEITHDAEKKPRIVLHGAARSLAQSKNISSWSVSITHTKETAAAVAIAAGSEK